MYNRHRKYFKIASKHEINIKLRDIQRQSFREKIEIRS